MASQLRYFFNSIGILKGIPSKYKGKPMLALDHNLARNNFHYSIFSEQIFIH
jgi:hypothetical protein